MEFHESMIAFHESSLAFHNSIPKTERAEAGIYFTPKKVRDKLFHALPAVLNQNMCRPIRILSEPIRILEPSFGSGEFLRDVLERFPGAQVVGVENHPELFGKTKENLSALPDLFCQDFLEWSHPQSFDLILGNPPYFSCKKKSPALTGRANAYVLFLYKCLTQHLSPDGILAFVLPTSLYNSSFYQPMRDLLFQKTILHLETLVKPGFHDTTQETMLLVLQNKPGKGDYFFQDKYLTPYWKELTLLVQNTTTLSQLGLGVKTGNIVWNQHKESLTDEGTLLVYSSNIKDGKLVYPPLKLPKKQYIQSDKPALDGPVLLVERGYGNSYHFHFALVDLKGFYAENHINVIYPITPDAFKNLSKVAASFQDPRTKQFIQQFVGNGALSAGELERFPVFI